MSAKLGGPDSSTLTGVKFIAGIPEVPQTNGFSAAALILVSAPAVTSSITAPTERAAFAS